MMRIVLGMLLIAMATTGMSFGSPPVISTPVVSTGELFIGAVADVEAFHCEECFENSTSHTFIGMACGSEASPSCYDCHAWNACHTNTQAGTCSEWHQACHGDGFALESALRSGDGGEVRALLATTEGRVTWNAERRAIQLKDCHGHLVAHYPVATDLAEALNL